MTATKFVMFFPVLDRCDRGQLPEQLAVFLLVMKLTAPHATCRDRLPQVRIEFGRRVSGLENARVLTDGLRHPYPVTLVNSGLTYSILPLRSVMTTDIGLCWMA